MVQPTNEILTPYPILRPILNMFEGLWADLIDAYWRLIGGVDWGWDSNEEWRLYRTTHKLKMWMRRAKAKLLWRTSSATVLQDSVGDDLARRIVGLL